MTAEQVDEIAARLAPYLIDPNTVAIAVSRGYPLVSRGYDPQGIFRCAIFDKSRSIDNGRMLYCGLHLTIELASACLFDDYLASIGAENVCVFRP